MSREEKPHDKNENVNPSSSVESLTNSKGPARRGDVDATWSRESLPGLESVGDGGSGRGYLVDPVDRSYTSIELLDSQRRADGRDIDALTTAELCDPTVTPGHGDLPDVVTGEKQNGNHESRMSNFRGRRSVSVPKRLATARGIRQKDCWRRLTSRPISRNRLRQTDPLPVGSVTRSRSVNWSTCAQPGGKSVDRNRLDGMEKSRRQVFRRKRPTIEETIGFSEEEQTAYRKFGLLDDQIKKEIMNEHDELSRTRRFLELLTVGPTSRPLESLTVGPTSRSLESLTVGPTSHPLESLIGALTELGHGWLAAELRTEIAVQSGQLLVEEYVYREAGVIAFKQFGSSRRWAHHELKELQALLAVRYQAGKEAWGGALRSTDTDTDRDGLRGEFDTCNRSLRQVVQQVEDFMRKNEQQLTQGKFTPTPMAPADSDPDCRRNYVGDVADAVEKLLASAAALQLQKENSERERQRCFEVLDVDVGRGAGGHLDVVLEETLRQAAATSLRRAKEAEISERVAQRLDEKMAAIQREADRNESAFNRQNTYMSTLVKQREDKIRQLHKLSSEHAEKVEDLQEQVSLWQARCGMLEKTRRLGYYHPGWSDELYGMEDIEYSRSRGRNQLVSIGGARSSSESSGRRGGSVRFVRENRKENNQVAKEKEN